MVIMPGDSLFLSLLPFFECTSSLEASFWLDNFSLSSIFELFMTDWAGQFSNFLVSLMICSSCNLMQASFYFLSVTSYRGWPSWHSSPPPNYLHLLSWLAWQWSWKTQLQFLTWKPISTKTKKNHYCSSLPPHRAEFEALSSLHLTKHFLQQVLCFRGRFRHLFDNGHHCGLSHTSHFHSINLLLGMVQAC